VHAVGLAGVGVLADMARTPQPKAKRVRKAKGGEEVDLSSVFKSPTAARAGRTPGRAEASRTPPTSFDIATPDSTNGRPRGAAAKKIATVAAEVTALEARIRAGQAERPRRREAAPVSSSSSSSGSSSSRESSAEHAERSTRGDRHLRKLARDRARGRARDRGQQVRRELDSKPSRKLFNWEVSRHEARCATEYLPDIIATGSVSDHARRTVMERQLKSAHEVDSYLLAAFVVDSLVAESRGNLLDSEAVEVLCRRLWCFEESTRDVIGLDELKKARGTVAAVYRAEDVVPGIGSAAVCHGMRRSLNKKLKQQTSDAAALGRAAASK